MDSNKDAVIAPVRVRSRARLIRAAHLLRDAGLVVTTRRVAHVCGMRRSAAKNTFLRCTPEELKGFTLVREVEHKRLLTISRIRWIRKLHGETGLPPLNMTQLAQRAGYERTSFQKFLRGEPDLREEIKKFP